MSTLTDSPEFTANEIYEIQQTDPVEGAASGASFGGIGVANQPHQQLANRTALLRNNQLNDEGNIASLQAFVAKFVGLMAADGYLKIPVNDVNKGLIEYVVQWGAQFPSGKLANDQTYAVAWPLEFPNACVWAMAALSNSTADVNCGKLLMETVGFNEVDGIFMSDYIGGSQLSQHANDGFYWVAIGY